MAKKPYKLLEILNGELTEMLFPAFLDLNLCIGQLMLDPIHDQGLRLFLEHLGRLM